MVVSYRIVSGGYYLVYIFSVLSKPHATRASPATSTDVSLFTDEDDEEDAESLVFNAKSLPE